MWNIYLIFHFYSRWEILKLKKLKKENTKIEIKVSKKVKKMNEEIEQQLKESIMDNENMNQAWM